MALKTFYCMRPVLWIGIAANVYAVAFALNLSPLAAHYIAVVLCTISAFAFVINDYLDFEIDSANANERPRPSIWTVVLLFAVSSLTISLPLAPPLSAIGIENRMLIVLFSLLLLAALYSIVFSRVIFAKNLVAAVLAVSPVWICLLAAGNTAPHASLSVLWIAIALGLFIFAREMKFDEFDMYGDKLAGRRTLAHTLPHQALLLIERALTSLGATILILVAWRGGNDTMLLTAALVLAFMMFGALYFPLSSNSHQCYYKATRFSMIISPIYVILLI